MLCDLCVKNTLQSDSVLDTDAAAEGLLKPSEEALDAVLLLLLRHLPLGVRVI